MVLGVSVCGVVRMFTRMYIDINKFGLLKNLEKDLNSWFKKGTNIKFRKKKEKIRSCFETLKNALKNAIKITFLKSLHNFLKH